MMKFRQAAWFLVWMGLVSVGSAAVRTGLDCAAAHRTLFAGKRVGIIANHTACDARGRFIVEVFKAMEGVTIARVVHSRARPLWY